ncbi:MAG: hypothetical protein K2X82_07420 [Gemmataceae bacterium]|nr:hypothetical protein [Gemmataceae bacterium]
MSRPVRLLASLPLLALAVGVFRVPGARADDPPAKADTSGTKPGGEFAGFTFVKDRPDDEFLDFPKDAPPDLAGKRLQVRVTESGGRKWVLPMYVVQNVRVPGPGETAATVVLTDALYHPEYERAVATAMTAKYGRDWSKAVPIDNRVATILRLTVGDDEVPLSTYRFKREVGRPDGRIDLTFPLDPTAAGRLAAAPRGSVGLTFEETYRGMFTEAELRATATVASTAATNFVNNFRPDARGQRATLLVSIGGGVDNRVSVRSQFTRHVAAEVWTKEGTSPNSTQVDAMVTKLFAGVTEEKSLGDKPNEAVVTFLTANGVKATASLGTYKGLKDQWKKETDSLKEDESARAWEQRRKRAVEGKGWGVEAKFEMEDEDKTSAMDRFKRQFRAMDEVMKSIDGELPVAVLSADQVQQVASRADSVLTVTTGSFRDGRKAMRHPQSLAEAFPKSESEKRREALAKASAELAAAREARAVAATARDAVAAENKPHEERLDGLKKRAAEASGAVASAAKAVKEREEEVRQDFENRSKNSVVKVKPEFKEQHIRRLIEQDGRKAELDAALKTHTRTAETWAAEVATNDKTLAPMRNKLATAEKAVADAKAEVTRLEAKKAALEQLAREDAPPTTKEVAHAHRARRTHCRDRCWCRPGGRPAEARLQGRRDEAEAAPRCRRWG